MNCTQRGLETVFSDTRGSSDEPALLPCAKMPRHERGTHKKHWHLFSAVLLEIFWQMHDIEKFRIQIS